VTALLELHPLLLGMDWMDPKWLFKEFGDAFFWVSLVIVFIECGLLFPFLPGDTLLFSVGLFIASEGAYHLDVNLFFALVAFTVAAVLGNLAGYEIGRWAGPPLHARDGRIVKKKHLDKTTDFFERHGSKALVVGRFVPFVRTFITVVAGITRMHRGRFATWSLVGALLWVFSITLLGYFLGTAVPGLGENIDYIIIAILAFSLVPVVYEWWKHQRHEHADRQAEAD
jgi:membrane-associated protein